MARQGRLIIPGIPHHITQRGNRRQDIFYSDNDRLKFQEALIYYSNKFGMLIIAYCYMTNHFHLVAVPKNKDSFKLVLHALLSLYATMINVSRGECGHLFQCRFFSSPLDERHTWAAIKYSEFNAVRAGLVTDPRDYRWCSAHSLKTGKPDPLLTREEPWVQLINKVHDVIYRDLAYQLSTPDPDFLTIKTRTYQGRPSGSSDFIKQLEASTGRRLLPRPVGRPRAKKK